LQSFAWRPFSWINQVFVRATFDQLLCPWLFEGEARSGKVASFISAFISAIEAEDLVELADEESAPFEDLVVSLRVVHALIAIPLDRSYCDDLERLKAVEGKLTDKPQRRVLRAVRGDSFWSGKLDQFERASTQIVANGAILESAVKDLTGESVTTRLGFAEVEGGKKLATYCKAYAEATNAIPRAAMAHIEYPLEKSVMIFLKACADIEDLGEELEATLQDTLKIAKVAFPTSLEFLDYEANLAKTRENKESTRKLKDLATTLSKALEGDVDVLDLASAEAKAWHNDLKGRHAQSGGHQPHVGDLFAGHICVGEMLREVRGQLMGRWC